jgi:hypothetical protein
MNNKYLKYKKKYLDLKYRTALGGDAETFIDKLSPDMVTMYNELNTPEHAKYIEYKENFNLFKILKKSNLIGEGSNNFIHKYDDETVLLKSKKPITIDDIILFLYLNEVNDQNPVSGPFFTPLKYLCLYIVFHIVGQEFFNILRTKKQLGYLVNFNLSNIRSEYYFIEKIQSDKSCELVLKEILLFNNNIIKLVKKCNLNEIKTTVKNKLEEKENSLSDYYSKYFSEIISKEYMFNRDIIILKHLNSINKKILIETVNTFILNNNNMCILNVNGN